MGVCDQTEGNTIFDGNCVSLTASQVLQYPDVQLSVDQNNPFPVTIKAADYIVKGFCNVRTLAG